MAEQQAQSIGSRRADIAVLIGLVVAIGSIAGGLILEGGRLTDLAQVSAALIVLGGTIGAVLITTPLAIARSAARRIPSLAFEQRILPEAVIEEIIAFSQKARKNGVVSLESEIGRIQDPFLLKALKLAVDGTDLKHIRSMMDLEIRLEMAESETDARVWEAAGGYAPTIGILGAVIGLIQVMKHLDELSKVGEGIAIAFVATIYGVGFANLIFLPIGQKIRMRAQQMLQTRHLMLEGVAGISESTNPTLIRRKLEAFVRDPRARARRKLETTAPPRQAASA